MDMVVLLVVGIYLIIGGLTMFLFADDVTEVGKVLAYGFFWPITLLVGLVWILTVEFRVFLKAIKSWNWHENS